MTTGGSGRISRETVRRAALRLVGPPLALAGKVARRASPATPGKPLRVLLIRPDHLGDMLLAGPAAIIVAAALPGAQIDWLVGPWAAEIARRCGGPGEVLTVPFPGFTRTPKASPLEPYRLLLHEAAQLRACHYDAALILRPDHWWGAMLAAAAGIPRRFGFNVAECRPFLTDTLPLPTGEQRHAVLMNQALAREAAVRLGPIAASNAVLSSHFPLDPADEAWARAWIDGLPDAEPAVPSPTALSDAARSRSPLVVVHPGSGALLKNWPSARWAEVARHLREQAGAQVVLTGGPAENSLVASVAALLDPPPPALVGATTLGQLAALFANADVVLGGDSGPLHLAAAVGTPTVRVYGPTDAAEFGPWPPGPQQIALAAGLFCQPCRALVNPPCGAIEQPACLDAIQAQSVVVAALSVLGRKHLGRVSGAPEQPPASMPLGS